MNDVKFFKYELEAAFFVLYLSIFFLLSLFFKLEGILNFFANPIVIFFNFFLYTFCVFTDGNTQKITKKRIFTMGFYPILFFYYFFIRPFSYAEANAKGVNEMKKK